MDRVCEVAGCGQEAVGQESGGGLAVDTIDDFALGSDVMCNASWTLQRSGAQALERSQTKYSFIYIRLQETQSFR